MNENKSENEIFKPIRFNLEGAVPPKTEIADSEQASENKEGVKDE